MRIFQFSNELRAARQTFWKRDTYPRLIIFYKCFVYDLGLVAYIKKLKKKIAQNPHSAPFYMNI